MQINLIIIIITQSTEIYIECEKLNSFMDRGLIKVIKKGDTTGEELKNWRPITLLSQIYKLISGVIAGRMKKLLKKLIFGCQKAYQNTATIREILLDILETIAMEILLLRMMLDDNVTKIKLTHPTHSKEDGGSLPIPPLQCFADDMTCVIEETRRKEGQWPD